MSEKVARKHKTVPAGVDEDIGEKFPIPILDKLSNPVLIWISNYSITDGVIHEVDLRIDVPQAEVIKNSYLLNEKTLKQLAQVEVSVIAGGHYL